MPSVQQITAATNIRSEFLAKRFRYAMLIARCQAGKTGAFQELIRLMLFNGDINRAYILCGSSETELRDQAHADTRKANPDAYARGDVKVLFRQDFKGADLDMTRALIIVDESHMDQTQKQELDRFLGRHGLSMDGNPRTLDEKDAYLVSVDATPYSELSALMYKESHPKHVEQLAPGANYFGIQDYLYGGLIKPTYDISTDESAFEQMVVSRGKKYGLMRLTSGKQAEKQEAAARAVYRRLGGNVLFFTAEKTEIDIASLKEAPRVATLIIVRGRLRAGKVVPKKHVSFVWEGAKASKTDALVQGLVGRMCGYPFHEESNPSGYGDDMPLIFVPQSALTRREDKVLKASELERAIMEYPVALPTMGTNLKKGHIAARPGNGTTECPPLRLTWDGWVFACKNDKFLREYNAKQIDLTSLIIFQNHLVYVETPVTNEEGFKAAMEQAQVTFSDGEKPVELRWDDGAVIKMVTVLLDELRDIKAEEYAKWKALRLKQQVEYLEWNLKHPSRWFWSEDRHPRYSIRPDEMVEMERLHPGYRHHIDLVCDHLNHMGHRAGWTWSNENSELLDARLKELKIAGAI
jgi:hypothetical protein